MIPHKLDILPDSLNSIYLYLYLVLMLELIIYLSHDNLKDIYIFLIHYNFLLTLHLILILVVHLLILIRIYDNPYTLVYLNLLDI